jgi:dienelactone hydrolase
MDYESECVSGIEVHVFGRAEGRPVVLVTHGRGGHLGDTHALCRRLATVGLTAVGVEQRNHGRRLVSKATNEHTATHAADMYGLIVGTASDMVLLLDFLPARLGIDTSRTGVTGVSLGGHVTLMAMGLDARFAAGAAFIGSGDYEALMRSRHAFNEFKTLPWNEFYPEPLAACVRRFDPVYRPGVYADRPVLLLNGGDDTLVPLTGNRSFEAAVRPGYHHQERLRLSVYPDVGHQVTEAMEADAVAWLQKWLIPTQE